MAVIDTLQFAEELARDGVFTREQAERLARISAKTATEALASKSDVALIRDDLDSVRTDLESAIATTRADLEGAIATTRADLQSAIAQTRIDLEGVIALTRTQLEVQTQTTGKELIKWFAGIMLAHGITVIGVTVALIKLL